MLTGGGGGAGLEIFRGYLEIVRFLDYPRVGKCPGTQESGLAKFRRKNDL